MHDVNFFYEYRSMAQRERSNRLMRNVAVCLAMGLALGTYLGNEIRIGHFSRIEASLAQTLNDPSQVEQYRAANQKEIELLLLMAYESWLVRMDENIGSNHGNNLRWFQHAFNKAPVSTELERISIHEGSFSITGYALNEEVIAGYKSSLDGIPDVSGTSIQRVEFAENRYRFSISGVLSSK